MHLFIRCNDLFLLPGKACRWGLQFLIAVLTSLLFFSSSSAQPQAINELQQLKNELNTKRTDTGKVASLFKIGNYYYNNRKLNKSFLDSNLAVLEQAETISKRIKFKKGEYEALWKKSFLYHINFLREKAKTESSKLNDTSYIRLMIRLGTYYINDRSARSNKDTAFMFFMQAKQKAVEIKADSIAAYMLYYLAYYSYSFSEFPPGKSYADEAGIYYRKAGIPVHAGSLWYRLGRLQDTALGNFNEIKYCYQRAAVLYKEVKRKEEEGLAHFYLGNLYLNQNILDLAEKELTTCETMLKEARYNKIYTAYSSLHDLYRLKGDMPKAIYYCLETIKQAEAAGDKMLGNIYATLARDYLDLEELEKSIATYRKAIELLEKDGTFVPGTITKGFVKALIADGKPNQALQFLQEHSKTLKNFGKTDMMVIAESYGNCYLALQQFEQAEKYYLDMYSYSKALHPSARVLAYLSLGKYYFIKGQYEKAQEYLTQFVKVPEYGPPAVMGEGYQLLYKIDSINHDYAASLINFRKYKQQTDIIFTQTKANQVAELEIKYATEKKDKDLLLKDQSILLKEKDIDLLRQQNLLQQILTDKSNRDLLLKEQAIALLTRQAELDKITATGKDNDLELNEKNLLLLTKQAAIQQSKLQKARLLKNITAGGITVLIILLGLFYMQYKRKRNNNRNVHQKNKVLESLIHEKEWLLKEVHHRVKNNLQTVVSLLESQSAFLQNDALLAIHDSQNRVHAMSLIHQSLYQENNVATINMAVYLQQLADYLKEIFKTNNNIFIEVEVPPIELDVSQAVPVGLIVNEAITNSIKYAFAGLNNRKCIGIILRQGPDYKTELIISDNGSGLSAPDVTKTTGLGLKLMRGLTEGDLEGQFSIVNDKGTTISVSFFAEHSGNIKIQA